MSEMNAAEMSEQLKAVDRALLTLKKQAKARYGSHRADWPADVRQEIQARKEQAKAFRRALGLREN